MTIKWQFIDYLIDIIDTIDKIDNFTQGMDFIKFTADDKTVFAVIRALEIIGEAAKNMPECKFRWRNESHNSRTPGRNSSLAGG
ncbi:MAG: DUF86 domain-containing protein [Methanosarcinales archaeon]|nr:DUF86 domain-containing protein [Methanosarcinales archaeon]